RTFVYVDNPVLFAEFISLLIQQGLSFDQLVELTESGAVRFVTSVYLNPFMVNKYALGVVARFVAIQEDKSWEPEYFGNKFLSSEELAGLFSSLPSTGRLAFKRFCVAAERYAVHIPASEVAAPVVNNAYDDFLNPERCKLIIRKLLIEKLRLVGTSDIPDFEVTVQPVNSNYREVANNFGSLVIGKDSDGGYEIFEIDTNLPQSLTASMSGLALAGLGTQPLSVAAVGNLHIRIAARLNCDLFLARPLSGIVGDKLLEIGSHESSATELNIQTAIDRIERNVVFPDLRHLVNVGEIDFGDVLRFRNEASRFRSWLQQDADRDIDALVAYHSEVARSSGYSRAAGRVLSLFGVLTAATAGIYLGTALNSGPVERIVLDAVALAAAKVIDDKYNKLGVGWKPVCFGDWYNNEIVQLLRQNPKSRNPM
ncbi:MAG: hypothetical protein ABIP75_02345, partial [Pyrinomonadaceae bacterium]